jgi:hypothetical protein
VIGKIDAVRYLFDKQHCPSSVKVMAPTRIAAADTLKSADISQLLLLNCNLLGERLHQEVKLPRHRRVLVFELLIKDVLDSQFNKIY